MVRVSTPVLPFTAEGSAAAASFAAPSSLAVFSPTQPSSSPAAGLVPAPSGAAVSGVAGGESDAAAGAGVLPPHPVATKAASIISEENENEGDGEATRMATDTNPLARAAAARNSAAAARVALRRQKCALCPSSGLSRP